LEKADFAASRLQISCDSRQSDKISRRVDASIRQYRLPPDAFGEVERRLRNTALIPQLSMLAVVVLVSTLLFARGARDLKAVLPVAAFAALFLTYVAFVSPKRLHGRRLSRLWDTYVLEIGSDHLLRQGDTPDVRLSFAEIRSIERRPGNGLRVIGKTRYQVIGIPESIEQFEEILDLVTPLAPVTPPRADRALRANITMGLGFAAYMGMPWSNSPWIVFPLAAAVTALLVWRFVVLQRSPNVTRSARRTGWLYLIFVVTCRLKVLQTIGMMRAR
jgi:hypothetical protein